LLDLFEQGRVIPGRLSQKYLKIYIHMLDNNV
jgi:hypothetical protein